ncbi:MAG TPA: phosphatidylinositol-specific phospholipase C domain-containing protein [Bacteroidales bacterium]|nr:phosphatidylinositol-specific phospholipase C domain-containing protein [Bacteroidales bacterium]HSA42803.1 phosphatidylinositol-specific phospholipase C domain-containing protein [Bacteroidales bacterium]
MKKRKFFVAGLTVAFIVIVIFSCRKEQFDSETDDSPRRGHAVDDDRALPYTYCDWMSKLDDNAFITRVTIPGTHDCGADLHTSEQGAASDEVIAQHFRLSNQLKLGVRWFDVRVALNDDGGLTIFHGDYYLHKTFHDLLSEALDFLEKYPSEVIIFMIKQEHTAQRDSDYGNFIYQALEAVGLEHFFLNADFIPTIGELRGKIMIVRQFENDLNKDFGYHFKWDKNTKGDYFTTENCKLYVQDHYSCFWVTDGTKNDEIKDCVRKANQATDHSCFYLNFTSCERDVEDLKSIASGINPVISSWLITPPVLYQCGIIMVNFAGGSDDGSVSSDFVKHIIECNVFVTNEFTLDNQIWKTRNLYVTHYSNGDPIVFAFIPQMWEFCGQFGIGAFTFTTLQGDFGMYYNWAAVNDPRGLGPKGWRVPSEFDFFDLGAHLGGDSVAGGKMKLNESMVYWKTPNTGATNSSGFTAIPMGYRDSIGNYLENTVFEPYSGTGISANFWTTSEIDQYHAIAYRLQYNTAALLHGSFSKRNGCSVRLVKDY